MNPPKKYPRLEKLQPQTCISGNIMKCNRIVANIFRKHLKPFQLTDSQLSILFVVMKAGLVNQKRISEILFMEKSTVNRNIGRLLDKKYIHQDTNLFLSPTESGKAFLENVMPHWELAMAEIQEILGKDGSEALHLITYKLT